MATDCKSSTITLTYRCGHSRLYPGALFKDIDRGEVLRRIAYLERGRCSACLADAQPYATRRPNPTAWRVRR